MGADRPEYDGRNTLSLPRFFSRISDSFDPLLLSASGTADLRDFLSRKRVTIEVAHEIDSHPYHVAGLLLLVNLCARLYPVIRVVAPRRIVDECRGVALQINPLCEIVEAVVGGQELEGEASDGVICWATKTSGPDAIGIAPVGWDVVIDPVDPPRIESTNVLTALAAAAIAASELFRQVFAEYLKGERRAASPGRFSLLTNAPHPNQPLPELPSDIPLGRVHLVGAGAVGQAAIYTLARVSATGTLTVVDPEVISESNLQRYVLATDADVGASKCALAQRALAKSRLDVVAVEAEWNIGLPETKNAQVVCAAVDSAETRIALQASLPARVYNAWTQPQDIGWSRHERFSDKPCLACLYWPTGSRPSYHELVARSIKQHELRVLAYVLNKIPINVPLQSAQIPRVDGREPPAESQQWMRRSLLEDVVAALGVEPGSLAQWRGRLLPDLYRDGICGGALIRSQRADVPTEMAVPLAHQSVLAGIMLAAQLVIAARPELLAHRSDAIESRLDLLSGFPQVVGRPRQRSANCLCADQDFVRAYMRKWPFMLATEAQGPKP